jgi:hypothetical protein
MMVWSTGVCRAHISDQFNSVHFHSGQPDFGTLPRRGCVRGEQDDRPLSTSVGMGGIREPGSELSFERDEELERKRKLRYEKRVQDAQAQEKAGHWGRAGEIYEQIARLSRWTGSLRDRVEVCRQAARLRKPLSPEFVRLLNLYLDTIPVTEDRLEGGAKASLERIYANPAAQFLRGHALYQLASLARDQGAMPEAGRLYQQTLREFPRTVKREACLIMWARCALLPDSPDATQLREGENALAQLERAFPHTRFRRASLGMRGRIAFMRGHYTEALRCYFAVGDLESVEIVRKQLPANAQGEARERLLAGYLRRLNTQRYASYERAIYDIWRTRSSLSLVEAMQFSKRIRRELDLIPPYLYYRLYHCDNKARDFATMAELADTVVAQYGVARLSSSVRVKLAEVYYQRRQYAKALRWAEWAQQPVAFDRALFVQGATLHKLHRYREALTAFETLMRRYGKSSLRHAAREELAILYEAVGDLGSALDQYFALDYQADIAFFLDAKMTPKQIEAYLRSRPDGPLKHDLEEWRWAEFKVKPALYRRHTLLAYTLGLRYMRQERWREAADWLRRVPRAAYLAFSVGRVKWENRSSPDPLTTIRDLSRLQRAAAAARTDDARAAALFRYASYYYTHGTLLLYNPALWQHERMENFDFWWNPGHATPQDDADARAFMYAHEVYARTLKLCKEIVRRYPKSPSAPQALYRGACAAHYLANFNDWWRKESKHHDHDAESVAMLKRLAQRYPKHPLAHEAVKYGAVFAQEAQERRQWRSF